MKNISIIIRGSKDKCYDPLFPDQAEVQLNVLMEAEKVDNCNIVVNYDECSVTLRYHTKDPELQHDYRTRLCFMKSVGETMEDHGTKWFEEHGENLLASWGKKLKEDAQWMLLHNIAIK